MGAAASGSRPVATVVDVWRYPVKSMAAEPLDSVEVSWHGLLGDRRWAFVRPGSERNGFPWHTIRENPAMSLFRPRLVEPGRPDHSSVEVLTPDGRILGITDPALADALGPGVRVLRLHTGAFDSMPVSVITTATVAAVCDRADVVSEPLRFRPNVLVDTGSTEPFTEDAWVGATLQIGDATLRVDRHDERCIVVNCDPETGKTSPEVLRVVGREHGARAGVYGSTSRPGEVAPGAPVLLL